MEVIANESTEVNMINVCAFVDRCKFSIALKVLLRIHWCHSVATMVRHQSCESLGAPDMIGYFECKTASNGQFMFNFNAGNQELILTSKFCATKAGLLRGPRVRRGECFGRHHFHPKGGQWWIPLLRSGPGNQQTMERSGMYSSADAMEKESRRPKN